MNDQLNAKLAQLAAVLSADIDLVAAKLDDLKAQLAASADPVDPAVLAALQAASDKLDALAK